LLRFADAHLLHALKKYTHAGTLDRTAGNDYIMGWRTEELWLNSWQGQNTFLLKCTDQVSGTTSLTCSVLFSEMMMMIITFLSPRVKKKNLIKATDPHFYLCFADCASQYI